MNAVEDVWFAIFMLSIPVAFNAIRVFTYLNCSACAFVTAWMYTCAAEIRKSSQRSGCVEHNLANIHNFFLNFVLHLPSSFLYALSFLYLVPP